MFALNPLSIIETLNYESLHGWKVRQASAGKYLGSQ